MAKIRLTPAAVTDLQEIKEYISKELYNPMAADRIINKIIYDYTLLETSPFMGTSLSSILPVKTDYRYFVSGKYLIFYKVDNEFVSIYRILYGRRDYMRILFSEIDSENEEE